MSDAATADLPLTFSSFVVSLATSAMLHLGEAPDPQTRQVRRDLALARNTIDLLGLLQQKTTGNLDAEEAQLLETLLYELRLKFVEAARQQANNS